MHVRMLDAGASLQQEALGIVGVNLCYSAFFLHHMPERLVESLLHMLTTGRVEIDVIQFSGIEFRNVDNRVMALQLVQLGLSGAAMFGADREVLQPTEVLYKKAVLVERGSFRPTTNVNLDMVACALAKFKADPAVADKPVLPIMEITMRNLDFTSLATPGSALRDEYGHVSGAIAAFLSIRKEFIGEPERVKKIFTSTATDLGLDRYFQGSGLVDLMRAIQSV